MDCNKKTKNDSGQEWPAAGPSRSDTPEKAASRSLPPAALIAIDINSADEVRQAVKSVLNESKIPDPDKADPDKVDPDKIIDPDKTDSSTANSQNEDNNAEDKKTPEQKVENKTLYDIVKMTIQIVEESDNKRESKKHEHQKHHDNKITKKRHSNRRIKAVPKKKTKYSKVFTGRLSNVAGLKSKKRRACNCKACDSESDLESLYTGSSRSSN